MANRAFHARKGLIVANSLIHANDGKVGVNTDTPNVSFHVSGTDGIIVPVGNTSQRPTGVVGLFRYNSENSDYEFYRGSSWITFTEIAANVTANTTAALLTGTSNTHVLFDDSNVFGGSAGLTFNKTTNNFTVGNTVTALSYVIGSSFVSNTSGLYHTGTMNAVSHTIGSDFIANTLGLYHTGLVNAASISAGPSSIVNTTGIFTTGTVNAVTLSVGSAFVANNSRIYHSTQLIIGTTHVANASGLYVNGTIDALSFSLTGSYGVNTSGIYHSGVVNAAILSTGTSVIANSTRLALATTVGLQANGGIGSAGQSLHSNGTTVYWATPTVYVSQVSSGNGLSGGPITGTGTLSVVANNGITANSTGLFVTPGTGVVVNATGVHVNSTYIGTLTSNNTSFVGSVSAANVVSNAQLSGNLAAYQTTAGLAAAVSVLSANNASFLGGVGHNSYQLNSTLAANVAGMSANNASFLGGAAAASYAVKNGDNHTGVHTFYGNGVFMNTALNSYTLTVYGGANANFGGLISYSQDGTKYGAIGIQNTYAFYGAGDVYSQGSALFTGNVTAYFSDKRLKKNIKQISDALSKIKTISGVFYQHNATAAKFGYAENKEEVGLLAQDVQKIVPQAISLAPFDVEIKDGKQVSKSGENYLTIDMTKLIPYLIESIKEIDFRLSRLEEKLEHVT